VSENEKIQLTHELKRAKSKFQLASPRVLRRPAGSGFGLYGEWNENFQIHSGRRGQKVGRCEGAKPYGELPGEQAIIERMRGLHSTGMGFDRIAAALNAEEIKPRRGARWHGLTVNKILTGKGRKAS
jgi:hypothetical protein